MMLLGGSPPLAICESDVAAGTARSEAPGTATSVFECFTAAGDWVDTMPMVTKSTRISAARPTTIMAGRMETPPEAGGRCGSRSSLMTP